MKNTITIIAFFLVTSLNVLAQKPVPIVDYKGHILNGKTQIGTLSSAGGFDQSGKSMTKIDGSGNIVDSTGKVLGKAPKNGSFVYYFNDKAEKYSIGKASHTGMCEVKNAKGEIVMLLHENYKQQAACAVHCLYENHCMPNVPHKH